MRWLLLSVTLGALAGCVGAVWQDEQTGQTETRVYTPLDLLPDGEEDPEAEDVAE